MSARLQGVYTALVTPFSDAGSLLLKKVPPLVAFQRSAGVDGLVVGGTNGEGVSLSVRERKRLLEAVLTHADGLEVIAATGACSLADAIELGRHARRCNVPAVLVLPPFYFKGVSPAGVAAYFVAVAAATRLPLILYSIPQFSHVPITEAILEGVLHMPYIVGVKESSPDKAAALGLLEHYRELKLFVGNDLYLAELLRKGAAGVISGTANAFPELVVAVARAVTAGHDPSVAQDRLNAAIGVLSQYPIVGAAKAVLRARQVTRISVRAPLVMPTAAEKRVMLRDLSRLGVLHLPRR